MYIICGRWISGERFSLTFTAGNATIHTRAAPWCSGLTYCPVKAEIAGSNPVGVATLDNCKNRCRLARITLGGHRIVYVSSASSSTAFAQIG